MDGHRNIQQIFLKKLFSLFFKNKTKILKVFHTFSKNIEHDQPFSCAFIFCFFCDFFPQLQWVTQVLLSWVRSTGSSSWVTQFIMLRHIWHSFHSEFHIVVTKFYSHLHINTQICHKKRKNVQLRPVHVHHPLVAITASTRQEREI